MVPPIDSSVFCEHIPVTVAYAHNSVVFQTTISMVNKSGKAVYDFQSIKLSIQTDFFIDQQGTMSLSTLGIDSTSV